MGQNDRSPGEKTSTLTPLDGGPTGVLAAQLDALTARLAALECGGSVAREAAHLKVLHLVSDEYMARLELFVKLGARARSLLQDLADEVADSKPENLPDIAAVVAAATAGDAPKKSPEGVSLPPELQSLLSSIMK